MGEIKCRMTLRITFCWPRLMLIIIFSYELKKEWFISIKEIPLNLVIWDLIWKLLKSWNSMSWIFKCKNVSVNVIEIIEDTEREHGWDKMPHDFTHYVFLSLLDANHYFFIRTQKEVIYLNHRNTTKSGDLRLNLKTILKLNFNVMNI
jgi:hypothetical protein